MGGLGASLTAYVEVLGNRIERQLPEPPFALPAFRWSDPACYPDRFEGDDNRENETIDDATDLGVAPGLHLEGMSINPGADTDWYSFELLRPASIVVDVQHSAARGDLDVELYALDEMQQPVLRGSSRSGKDHERIRVNELESGTYYIRVDSPTNEKNTYKLEVMPADETTRVFYVNNGSDNLADNYYTTEKGNDQNDGLSPRKPMRTLQRVLDVYDLGADDIVVFESGSHPAPATISAEDGGGIFAGSLGGSTLGPLVLNDVDHSIFYRLAMDAAGTNLELNGVRQSRFDRMQLTSEGTNIVMTDSDGNRFGGSGLTLTGVRNVELQNSDDNNFLGVAATATASNFELSDSDYNTIAQGNLVAGQSNVILSGADGNLIESNQLSSEADLEDIDQVLPRIAKRPGIWVGAAANDTSTNNVIRGNELRDHHTGIQIDSSRYNLVADNSLLGAGRIGIFVAPNVPAELRGNFVTGRDVGMYTDSPIAEVVDNEFNHNQIGIETLTGVIGPDNPAPYVSAAGKAPNRILNNDVGVSIPTGAAGVLLRFNEIRGNLVGVQSFGDRTQIVANLILENGVGVETTEIFGPANWDQQLHNIVRNNGIGARVSDGGEVRFNRFEANQAGVEILDRADVHHNLLIQNVVDGVRTKGSQDANIFNNTIHVTVGNGIRVMGFSSGVDIRNNLVWVETGYALFVAADSQFGYASDYNNWFTPGTGHVAFQGKDFVDIYDWQVEAEQDLHSLGYTVVSPTRDDPGFTFVDPATDEYRVAFRATSVDAGTPGDAFALEPAANGDRVNLGAYGNTTQATRSENEWLRITEPNYYRDLIPGETYEITWDHYHLTGSFLNVELVEEGVGTTVTIASQASVNLGGFTWSPSALGVSGDLLKRYRVRLTTTNTSPIVSALSREAFAIVPFDPAAADTFYVNDVVDPNDQYATAAGNNRNTGLTADAPKVVIRPLVLSYPMGPGDEIRVDTGTYVHAVNLNLSQLPQPNDPRMRGVYGTRILGPSSPEVNVARIDRANPHTGSRALNLTQSPGMSLENLHITGAEIGTSVRNASNDFVARLVSWFGHTLDGLSIQGQSDRAVLDQLSVFDNGRHGIVVESELEHLFDSVVHDNGQIGVALRNSGAARVEANDVYGNWRGMEVLNPASGTTIVGWTDWTQFRGNRVHNNDDDGIIAAGNVLVAHNTVSDNATIGIRLDNGADARGNVVRGHITGISAFGSSSDIVENRSYINSQSGIEASYFSQILRNVVYSNEVHGIHVEHFSGLIDHNLVYGTGNAPINVQGPGFDARLINNTVYEPCSVNPPPPNQGTVVTTDWDWQIVLQPPAPPPPPLLTPDPVFVSLWGNAEFTFGPAVADDGTSFDLGPGGGSLARSPEPLPRGPEWHIPFQVTGLQLSSQMFEPHPELGFVDVVSSALPGSGEIVVSNFGGQLAGHVALDLSVSFLFPAADLFLSPLEPLHVERELSLTSDMVLGEFEVLQAPFRLPGPLLEMGGSLIQTPDFPPWNWQMGDAFVTQETRGGVQHKGDFCPEIGVIIQDLSQDVFLRNNIIYVEGVSDGDPAFPASLDIVVMPDSIAGWDSEFNLLTTIHGAIGQFDGQLANSIENWRHVSGDDDYSISPDPDTIWVDPDGDDGLLAGTNGFDDNFHLFSPFGHAIQGAHAPILDDAVALGTDLPVFVSPLSERAPMPDADLVSPAVDWGDPSYDWMGEPGSVVLGGGVIQAIENGQLINLGAYGNTLHASAAPDDYFNIVYPLGAETLNTGKTYQFEWRTNIFGGNITIELFRDDITREFVDVLANPGVPVGIYTWTVPVGILPGQEFFVRFSLGGETYETRRRAIRIEDDGTAPYIVTSTPRIVDKQRWTNLDLACLSLTISENVDPVAAADPTNYELRGAGTNRTFGDGDDVFYSVTPLYSSAPHDGLPAAVDLDFGGILLPEGLYRLTAFSNGLADAAGFVLDGNRDGLGGDDYVRVFEIDQTSPTVSLPIIVPDPRNVGFSEMPVDFSEIVHGVGLANVRIARQNEPQALTGWQRYDEHDSVPNAFGSVAWQLEDIADLNPARPNPLLAEETALPDNAVSSWTLDWYPYGVVDRAGNPLLVGGAASWILDRQSPHVAIAPIAPDPTGPAVDQISLVFSEVVVGVSLSDIRMTRNGMPLPLTAANAPSSPDGITWTISGLAGLTNTTGVYVLAVDAHGLITDFAGNMLVDGGSETFVIDDQQPFGMFVDLPASRGGPLEEAVVRFNEPVRGVSVADFRLTRSPGGADLLATLFPPPTLTTQDGRNWHLSGLAPVTAADGQYTIELLATSSSITDDVGLPLSDNIQATWSTDGTPPTGMFDPITPNPRSTPVDSIRLVFSEPVAGLTSNSFQIKYAGPGPLPAQSGDEANSLVLQSEDGGQTWILSGLGNLTALDGDYEITLADGAGVMDLAGNSVSLPPPLAWMKDSAAPQVTILPVSPDPRKTQFDEMTIVFNESVLDVELSDLQFTHNGGVNLLSSATGLEFFSADGQSYRLGGLGSLTNSPGRYELSLAAPGSGITDVTGNPLLVGAFATVSVQSDGDVNRDDQVNVADIDALFAALRQAQATPRFDVNGDGHVNRRDMDFLVADIFQTRYGDANLDGSVDGVDFGIWFENRFTFGDGVSWADADFDGGQSVDGHDFNTWLANRFQTDVENAPAIGSKNAGRVPRAPLAARDAAFAEVADVLPAVEQRPPLPTEYRTRLARDEMLKRRGSRSVPGSAFDDYQESEEASRRLNSALRRFYAVSPGKHPILRFTTPSHSGTKVEGTGQTPSGPTDVRQGDNPDVA